MSHHAARVGSRPPIPLLFNSLALSPYMMAEQIHAGRHGIPHYQINSPTASFPLLEALRKSTHLGAQPVYPFHHVHLSFTLHPVTDSLTRQQGINPTSATIYAMGLSRYNAPHHLQSHVMYVPLIFPLTPYMHAYIHSTVSITYCAHITKSHYTRVLTVHGLFQHCCMGVPHASPHTVTSLLFVTLC